MMKKIILFSVYTFLISSLFAQHNFKEEMIRTGEKQERLDQFQLYESDYQSHKRTSAWNVKSSNISLFQNTAELDISIIGGRVRSSLVDVENDISLVAPSGGGLWSFDAQEGSHFEPINDFGAFLPITTIAQNPFNPENILLSTGDALHWTKGSGIFTSFDGGNTFNQVESTNPIDVPEFNYIRFVKFSPHTEGVAYLITSRKIFKSVNTGNDWNEVFESESGRIHSFDFLAKDSVIFSVDQMGLYSSSTGNEGTFSLITNGIPNSQNGDSQSIEGVVVASHANNRAISYAFFSGDSNDVYKTKDNGVTWEKVGSPTFYITQTWFCQTIGVHPTNPDIIVAGSVGWGYSKNGGVNWEKGAGLEVDFHDVHFHKSNPNIAYLGYDQGIGRVDFGTDALQWVWNGEEYVEVMQPEQIELGKFPGFNTSQIYYGDYFPEEYGDAFVMGQQDGGCFLKNNEYECRILVGDGGSVFVNKQDPLKAFASTQYGNIRFTENALQATYSDFTQINGFYENHPNFITQFAGNNADGKQIYVAKKNSIERTLDNAVSFDSIAKHELSGIKLALENSQDPNLYAIGRNSTKNKPMILKVSGAAQTPIGDIDSFLLDINEGTPDHINVDPNDRNIVYVTFYSGNLYEVSKLDSVPIIKDLKGDIGDVVFNTVIGIPEKEDLLIAGTNIGLFYSENGGNSWVLSNEIPYTQVTDVKFRPSDSRLFVFTYGRGAWATTLKETNTSIVHRKKNEIINVFPNPCNEYLNIEIEDNKDVLVALFDVSGKKVLESEDLKKIEVSQLAGGTYIMHISRNKLIIGTEKIIIE